MFTKGRVLIFAGLLAGKTSAWGQTYVVAFVGKITDGGDPFTFVAMNDIPMGTTIYITNWDWDNVSGAFTNPVSEGTLAVTTTALIPQGSVTRIEETSLGVFSSDTTTSMGTSTLATVGFATGTTDWSPSSGTPFYAFYASNSATPEATVTQILAVMITDTGTFSAAFDPTQGTNSSPDAIALFDEMRQYSYYDYTGDRSMATPATMADTANFGGTQASAGQSVDTTFFSSGNLPVTLTDFSIE